MEACGALLELHEPGVLIAHVRVCSPLVKQIKGTQAINLTIVKLKEKG